MELSPFLRNLSRRADGIWGQAENAAVSYPTTGHDTNLGFEDNSFWYRHRNRCIVSLVEKFPPADQGVIFDVGGGNGYVSLALNKAGFRTALVEPGLAGARNAKARGIEAVVCAEASPRYFQKNTLPAIGLFDVLEHVADDRRFLQDLRELLQPQGRLYVTVPAYRLLWSADDTYTGHYRRYTLRGLSRVMREAGFEVLFSSYIFWPLPLPVLLMRSLPYRLGLRRAHSITQEGIAADHRTGGGWPARLLDALLSWEWRRLARSRRMAFGGSCLLAARVKK